MCQQRNSLKSASGVESSQNDEEETTTNQASPEHFLFKTPGKHENYPHTEGCKERVASGVKWSFGDDATGVPEIVFHNGRHGRNCDCAIIRIRVTVKTQVGSFRQEGGVTDNIG